MDTGYRSGIVQHNRAGSTSPLGNLRRWMRRVRDALAAGHTVYYVKEGNKLDLRSMKLDGKSTNYVIVKST